MVLTAALLTKTVLTTTLMLSFNSIDVARQDFVTECELMREFSRTSMGIDGFREFVDEVYNIDESQCSVSVTNLNS